MLTVSAITIGEGNYVNGQTCGGSSESDESRAGTERPGNTGRSQVQTLPPIPCGGSSEILAKARA